MKKDDEGEFNRYQDNVLYDLFYSGQFQQTLDEASSVQLTEVRKTLITASAAALHGLEAAERKTSELSSDDASRGKLLVTAGQLVLRVRRYELGSALLAAGTEGATNAAVNQQQIAIFARTRKVEELPIPDNDPTSPVQKLVRVWFRLDSKPRSPTIQTRITTCISM